MNVPDLFELASKKKMNRLAEKAREKLSRESDKIIRGKVAKDAVYWSMEESAQELQVDNVWLEQNIEASHLQRDLVLAECSEELRSYDEAMDKIRDCLHASDEMEESALRLRRILQRCRADQHELGAKYEACGARLRDQASVGHDAAREEAARVTRARELEAVREQEERELEEALAECDASHAQQRAALERAQESARLALRTTEEALAAVQSDTARLLSEADAGCAERARACVAADAELQAARTEAEVTLRQWDAVRRSIVTERAERAAIVSELKTEVTSLGDNKKRMEKLLDEKNQCVASLVEQLDDVRSHIARVQLAARQTQSEVQVVLRQADAEADAQEKTTARADDEFAQRESELQRAARQEHAEADARRAEAEQRAAALERSLDDEARHIAQLMGLLKAEADGRARAEAELGDTRRAQEQLRAERGAARAQHSARARDQDDKLAAQRAVVEELQRRGRQLHERARVKQATIHNIQRELAAGVPPACPDDLYGFLSDGSLAGEALHDPVSLSQVKKNMKKNVRNKRHEAGARKHKE